MQDRRVDWADLGISETHQPRAETMGRAPDAGWLLGAFDELLGAVAIRAMSKRAVEIARERFSLTRAAIFLRDPTQRVMRGTWGTDLDGATVEEDFITFDLWEGCEEAFERDRSAGVYWMVVHDAPLVVHSRSATKVLGRGWVCCTPLRVDGSLSGIFFNDAGGGGETLDEVKQAQVAVWCSLVSVALDALKRRVPPVSIGSDSARPRAGSVARSLQLLHANPALTTRELAQKLRLSPSHLPRMFKAEVGESLVTYRNRLRVERFAMLLDQAGENLLEAALAAGFGSYAQFHQVFQSERGMTPGAFAKTRRRK